MQSLRALREKKQLTQQKTAAAIGVTRQLISAIESGQANPSVGTLMKLSKFFCIPVDDLLDDKERTPDASVSDS